jgi:hypothetical protein
MDDKTINQLREEEAALTRKLNAIRSVLAVYAPDAPTATALPAPVVRAAGPVARAPEQSRNKYAVANEMPHANAY